MKLTDLRKSVEKSVESVELMGLMDLIGSAESGESLVSIGS